MAKANKSIMGTTGEFYVAGQLSEFGLITCLTNKNAPGIDLLVSDGVSTKMIQVKTTTGSADWIISKMKPNPNLVYILVILNPSKDREKPVFHIVPSKKVHEQVEKAGQAYLKKREEQGNPVTVFGKGVDHFKDKEGKYRDKWKYLGFKFNTEVHAQ